MKGCIAQIVSDRCSRRLDSFSMLRTSDTRSVKRLPWVVAFAVAAIVAVGLRAGGWVPALSAGAGIRWEEAYAAMEAIETNLPDRERLVLANAEVEGPASEGIPVERRLRAAGTLVRVRYEVIGDDVANLVELRSLVPALPAFSAAAPAANSAGSTARATALRNSRRPIRSCWHAAARRALPTSGCCACRWVVRSTSASAR